MFLTQSNQIRNLTKNEFTMLHELCHISKNLYNVALYSLRQHYFTEKQCLCYEANYHVCKDNENYKLLQAGISQQILKVADRSFKSFFNLMKKAKTGEYRYQAIALPRYLKQDGLFPLILSTNAINIKDGYVILPSSRKYNKLHPDTKIKIPFPERLADKKIKEIRIIPKHHGQFFNIEFVYESPIEEKNLNHDHSLAIDIGLNNLAACVNSQTGASFIIDGKKLKSINQFYNKEKLRLQSIADKQGYKKTKHMATLTHKRNNQTKDYLAKTARTIINYCLANDIGTIVIGYNMGFKQNINIGRKNNKQFTQIAFGKLRENINNLCERYGLCYIETEESYTSKASFLDKDSMPVFNETNTTNHVFSGQRITRGLYQASNKQLLNADINGACNILVKSKQNFDFKELCNGLLVSPLRIRLPV